MKTFRLALGALIMFATLLALVVPETVWASPAHPNRSKVCWVHDANGVQYTDLECDYQEVIKYDENGNAILLQYHDHGQLPAGAALPHEAMRMIMHVDCDCMYDGDYMEVLMPNGAYMSHGPINKK
jgi:hypothetical protein